MTLVPLTTLALTMTLAGVRPAMTRIPGRPRRQRRNGGSCSPAPGDPFEHAPFRAWSSAARSPRI